MDLWFDVIDKFYTIVFYVGATLFGMGIIGFIATSIVVFIKGVIIFLFLF